MIEQVLAVARLTVLEITANYVRGVLWRLGGPEMPVTLAVGDTLILTAPVAMEEDGDDV